MGDYLRNLFIFIKIVYATNVFAQVLLLCFLLGQPFWSLGFTVLKFLYEGRGWDYQSRYFPKVTLCDFQIREANSLPVAHTYTVMCVLPINLFNQQIFTFLWFWFVIVIFFTFYDLLIWIYRLFLRRESYLQGRIKVMNKSLSGKWDPDDKCLQHINVEDNEKLMNVLNRRESFTTGDEVISLSDGQEIHQQSRMYIVPQMYYKDDKTLLDFFNSEYLEADGHFILRIIGTNASDFVATRILHGLYELCCEKRFIPNDVREEKPAQSRKTLSKYLILPGEKEEDDEFEDTQRKGTQESQHNLRPTTTSLPPIPVPRSSSRENQSSRETSNISEDNRAQNRVSRRSQSHGKHGNGQ